MRRLQAHQARQSHFVEKLCIATATKFYFAAQDVQKEVFEGWGSVETETLAEMSDYEGYQKDFLRLFGFGIEGVDYDEPVDVNVPIPDLIK